MTERRRRRRRQVHDAGHAAAQCSSVPWARGSGLHTLHWADEVGAASRRWSSPTSRSRPAKLNLAVPADRGHCRRNRSSSPSSSPTSTRQRFLAAVTERDAPAIRSGRPRPRRRADKRSLMAAFKTSLRDTPSGRKGRGPDRPGRDDEGRDDQAQPHLSAPAGLPAFPGYSRHRACVHRRGRPWTTTIATWRA